MFINNQKVVFLSQLGGKWNLKACMNRNEVEQLEI